jgi:hypothetical protein
MTDDLQDAIHRAAGIVARRWPSVIEADDAEQEIWVRLLENDYYDRVAGLEPAAQTSTLIRIGSQIASGYRDDYEVFSGQVYYATDEVRALLTSGLLDRRRDEIDAASETLTEWMDLHEGAQSLRDSHPAQAAVIARRFLLGEPVEHSQQVTRAVDALTRHMNQVHRRRSADYEGPGSRRAMSNAAAQHTTRGEA